jgi:hypothetical protein
MPPTSHVIAAEAVNDPDVPVTVTAYVPCSVFEDVCPPQPFMLASPAHASNNSSGRTHNRFLRKPMPNDIIKRHARLPVSFINKLDFAGPIVEIVT